MSISIYGLFLICYIACIIFKYKKSTLIFEKLFFISMVTTFYVKMGYFATISNKVITYTSLVTYVTGLLALFILSKKKKPFSLKSILVFYVLLISAFCGFFMPYNKTIITNFDHYLADMSNYIQYNDYFGRIDGIQLGYYLTTFFTVVILQCAHKILPEDMWHRMMNKNLIVSKIFITIAGADCFFVNVFKSNIITDLTILIFGNYGAQHNGIYMRGALAAFQGATQEASMLNFVLFYTLIFWLIEYQREKNRRCIPWIITINVLLLLNPSLSASSYLVIEIVIVCLGLLKGKKDNVRLIKLSLIFSCVFATCMFAYISLLNYSGSNYILTRLSDAFNLINGLVNMDVNTLGYSSNSIRLFGISYTLGIFADRPILGVGLGNVFCDSGVVSLIASIGIIGTTVWIIYLLQWAEGRKEFRLYSIIFFCAIYILPNIFANSVESMFLIMMPFLMLTYKKNILEQHDGFNMVGS